MTDRKHSQYKLFQDRAAMLFSSLCLLTLLCSMTPSVLAASPDGTKHDAEVKGYISFESRDEIVANAKKEGRVRALAEMEPNHIRATTAGFMKKYPFINLSVEEITGADQAQRFILEMKAGRIKDWDVVHLSADFRAEYIPHLLKIDILRMAGKGLLQIPIPMIDPLGRN